MRFRSIQSMFVVAATFGAAATTQAQSVSHVNLSRSAVIGGGTDFGTVYLNEAAPSGGIVISLKSSSAIASVPATITIAGGSTTANFSVATTPVASDSPVSVSARTGTSVRSTPLTVTAPVPTFLNVISTSVPGGNTVSFNVGISGPAPTGGLDLTLSTDSSSVTLPPTVHFPAGHIDARFYALTTPVPSDANATVKATLGAASKAVNLNLKAPTIRNLAFSSWIIYGGQSDQGIVNLTSAAPAGGITYSLSTTAPNVTVPSSVTIPEGKFVGYYPISTKPIPSGGTAVFVINGVSLVDLSFYSTGIQGISPWPKFRQNALNSGVATGFGATGVQKWTFSTGGFLDGSPAIGTDGTVYQASSDGNLYAIAPDGTQDWSLSLGAYSLSTPAVAVDSTIYLGAGSNLLAINPWGSVKWQFSTGYWVKSSPTIGPDGTVYVGSQDDYFYAINPWGTLKWKVKTAGPILSSPALGLDGTIYVGSEDYHLYAFNPDGTKKWAYKTNGPIDSSPVIGPDGTAYVGSDDGFFYAINSSGLKKWIFGLAGSPAHYCSPTFGLDGTIYIGTEYNSNLIALNPSGHLKWEFPYGELVSSPAIGGDGTIYFGSRDKHVYAVNPDGTMKWSVVTGDEVQASPAIGTDGTIYIGSIDQKVYAIK